MDLHRLLALVPDVLRISCPFERDDVKVKYTRITAEFVNNRLPDVLRAGCTLGWADCVDADTRTQVQAQTRKILGT